jgi:7,8-dihydropterin-6-yl-methyl-4-(beta-D-ribofuranosyl)aminobenzene 5'-phosphate synthase
MNRRVLNLCRLGRGTKPNTIDGALPNLPNTGLFVQALVTSYYIKVSEDFNITLPPLNKDAVQAAGISIVESTDPRLLVDGLLLFLGEVPKKSKFEKGFPRMHYDQDGQSHWDPIEDDTAVVANIRGKGLVVLSGCAHSGIINTVKYAREISGIEKIYAVMGGFHLSGADFEPIIEPTTEALKALNPEYVIPTHCTGRKATMHLEKEMPKQFLLNMSGTRMVFEGGEV